MTAKSPAAPGRSATRGARHGRGPLDPRKVLTAIREVVYDWDLCWFSTYETGGVFLG